MALPKLARVVAASLLALAGCAQILGIEELESTPDAQPFDGPIGTFSLTVTVNGGGRVTAGSAIDCPGMCTAFFPSGSGVTLFPEASQTLAVGSWTGCDTAANTCFVSMDSDRSVSVDFVPAELVTVTVIGRGVVNGDGGLACGTGTCIQQYPRDATVTLSPVPSAGATLLWSTPCGAASSCPILVDGAKAYTAVFFGGTTPVTELPISGARIDTLVATPEAGFVIAGPVTTGVTFSGQPPISSSSYVAMFSNSLETMWAFGQGATQFGSGFHFDAVSGSDQVVLPGRYTGAVNISGTNVPGVDPPEGFIASYNLTGSTAGAVAFAQAGTQVVRGVAPGNVGGTDGMWVFGEYTGSLTLGTATLNAVAGTDLFMVFLSGGVIFAGTARSYGGLGEDHIERVAANGGIAVIGTYTDDLVVGTETLTHDGANDVFVLRFDDQGELTWARGFTGAGDEVPGDVEVIGPSTAGVYAQGAVTTVSLWDATGTPVWSDTLSTAGGRALAALPGTDVLAVAGTFAGSLSFAGITLVSGTVDQFVALYRLDGTGFFAEKHGTLGADGVTDIAWLPGGPLLIAGTSSVAGNVYLVLAR